MKHCSRCATDKPTTAFTRHKAYRDGFKPWCKACFAAHEKARREVKGDHIRSLERKWRADNIAQRKECERRAGLKRRVEKQDDLAHRRRAWERDNRAKTASWSATKRARRRQAVPSWLTPEQRNEIAALYRQAKAITEATGVVHHVDHIEPLAGETVCGLHVPWNLRVIPATDNQAKGNRRIAA